MKLLMVCYGYPPTGGAGMLRAVKFAKYLPQFGWEPTVLTPHEGTPRIPCPRELGELPGVTVVRTEYVDIVDAVKRTLRIGRARRGAGGAPPASGAAPARHGRFSAPRRAIYEAVTTPDEHIGWYRPAVAIGCELLRRARYDAIFSTSPPETSHLVACALSRGSGLPWIAELRDPWSFDHYRERPMWKAGLLGWMERRTFRHASALVTVSARWQRELEKRHGAGGKPVYAIPHGFDEDDFPRHVAPAADRFLIRYTGSLDGRFQDPEPLFIALGRLVADGRIDRRVVRVEFLAYGDNLPDFEALAARYGLADVVERRPLLEYRACLAAQKASTALLVLQWRGDLAQGIQYIKSYEYLGARRPILAIGPGGDALEALLRETRGGRLAATPDEIAAVLAEWYGEFRRTGTLRFVGDEPAIQQYTRRAQTARLVAVLDRARVGSAARSAVAAGAAV